MLAVTVASILSTNNVIAQEADENGDTEIIQVTGIRSSIQASTALKKDATGVVDAISAEDIGKFPDTNLAESLQRITGVSINRENGEGKNITVRGFGDGFNLVTLNSRQMPTASVFAGGGNGSSGPSATSNASRSFDFSNLSSDSVKSVEVYKTSRANLASGGIGATVNINTLKPLDNEGLVASIGAKAIHDTTNVENSDYTPELSGLISYTNEDAVFGVALSFSHSERDSGSEQVTINNWNMGVVGVNDLYQLPADTSGIRIENAPANGQLYTRPDDIRYSDVETKRVRDNAQLTVQFAPTAGFVATLDYTYANNDIEQRRTEATSWMSTSGITELVFDSDPVVVAPIFVNTPNSTTSSLGQDQQYNAQENTLTSVGLNLEWQATDNLKVVFDAHSSEAESMPNGYKGAGQTAIQIAANTGTGQSYTYDGDVPLQTLERPNGLTPEMHSSQIGHIRYADQVTSVDQAKVDLSYEFDEGRFDFGIETRSVDMRNRNSVKQMTLGGWGASNPGDIPSNLLEIYNPSTMEGIPAGAPQLAMKGHAEDILESLIANPLYATANSGSPWTTDIESNWNSDNQIVEDTDAAYFQVHLNGELGGMETNFTAGLRYEDTSLSSTAYLRRFQGWLWFGNNDDRGLFGNSVEDVTTDFSYSNVLPAFDFDIAIRDDLIARFSYSKSISRAAYGQLQSDVSQFNFAGGSSFNGLTKTAQRNNPELLPIESDNIDLSLEWYFEDTSYVSLGLYEKRIKNFIGQASSTENVWGIRDQTIGPRVQAAVAQLQALGINTNDSNIYTALVLQAYPDAPELNGLTWDNFIQQGEPGYNQQITNAETVSFRTGDFVANSEDPLMMLSVSKPVNTSERQVYGAELAAQHFFGESGFGLQANYTIVRGDVHYDNSALPGANQFPLLGLSDTANLVAMYEKNGFSARVSWNWRDEHIITASRGSANNPIYTEAYSQIDMNVSYDVSKNLSIFVEAINITEEDRRDHGRTERMVEFYEDLGARYQIGARYTF